MGSESKRCLLLWVSLRLVGLAKAQHSDGCSESLFCFKLIFDLGFLTAGLHMGAAFQVFVLGLVVS